MLREKLQTALTAAMKARDARRVSTLRLVLAALKERDIAKRSEKPGNPVADDEIVSLLAKLIRQREESAALYEKGNRPALAAAEREEIAIIAEYLPRQMSDDEIRAAAVSTVAALSASSMKDMGRVMAALRERHGGSMDFGKAGAAVRQLLTLQ